MAAVTYYPAVDVYGESAERLEVEDGQTMAGIGSPTFSSANAAIASVARILAGGRGREFGWHRDLDDRTHYPQRLVHHRRSTG